MTCPTCHSPTRVVSCRLVGEEFFRRRRCENGHRSNTAEVLRPGPFPWAKKPARKAKPKPSDWLTRIEDKLATL